MKKSFLISFTLLLSTSFFSANAFAQAYTAKKMSPSQVIKLAVFDTAPVTFGHTLVKTERVLNRSRLDFEQTYDVAFDTFLAEIREAYTKKKNIGTLDPNIFPNGKVHELRIVGIGTSPDRATMGAKELYFNINFEMRANDAGQTVVLLNSAIRSLIFGGAIPARSPFRPVGAKPIKFRWE